MISFLGLLFNENITLCSCIKKSQKLSTVWFWCHIFICPHVKKCSCVTSQKLCCSAMAGGAETKTLSFRYLLSVFRDVLLLEAFVLLFRRDAPIATGRRLRRAELCVGRTQGSLCRIDNGPSETSQKEQNGVWNDLLPNLSHCVPLHLSSHWLA